MSKSTQAIHTRIVIGAIVVFIAMLVWFLGTVPASP